MNRWIWLLLGIAACVPSNDLDHDSASILATPLVTITPNPVVLGGADGLDFVRGMPIQISIDTGSQSWPWTATLTTSSNIGWLQISARSGTINGTPQSLFVNANRNLVDPGTHQGKIKISVTTDTGVVEGTTNVILNKAGHWLATSAAGVALSSVPGRQVLVRRVQVASSQGRTDVAWTASADQPWLSVTPSGNTGGDVVITAEPTGLAPDQEYFANVTIASSRSDITNVEHVRVGLWVGSTAPVAVAIPSRARLVVPNPVEPWVYVSDGMDQIAVYNVYSGAPVATFSWPDARIGSISISGDGTRLYVTDEVAFRLYELDAALGTILHPFFALPGTQTLYARPNGHPALLINNASILAIEPLGFAGSGGVTGDRLVADPLGRFVYTQDASSILRAFSLAYTQLTPGPFNVTPRAVVPGAGGVDLCVSSDGARVYAANRALAAFSVYRAADLMPLPSIPTVASPTNTACAWNGLFFGSAGVIISAYRPDGTRVSAFTLNPPFVHPLVPHTLALSGDNTRAMAMIEGGSAAPATFAITSAPSP